MGVESLASLAEPRAAEALDWLHDSMPRLSSTAEGVARIRAPYALLHFDTRSDNLRLARGGRLRLFDWPYACLGPPEFDVAAFVQSIAAEGGPEPERSLVWYAESPVIKVREAALDASIAALAGYFAWNAWQPPLPGLPRLRWIQRQQLRSSLAWCARRLGCRSRDGSKGSPVPRPAGAPGRLDQLREWSSRDAPALRQPTTIRDRLLSESDAQPGGCLQAARAAGSPARG